MHKADIRTWKDLALYLADCHAATLGDEGMRKSTSNWGRRRFTSICKTALTNIRTLAEDDMRAGSRDNEYAITVATRTENNIIAAEKMIAATTKVRVPKG